MIDTLTAAAFSDQLTHYDHTVGLTPGIDTFCSRAAWILSARAAFHVEAEPIFLADTHGYAAFFARSMPQWGRMLLPLESSWFLASPLACAHPHAFVPRFSEALTAALLPWDACLIAGLDRDGPLFAAVVGAFYGRRPLYQGPEVTRRIADLGDGVDAWLARRSSRFAKNLRRICRRVAEDRVHFEWWDAVLDEAACDSLFARILAVERRSWKGREGVGVDEGAMCVFYRRILAMQGPSGDARVGFAVRDGEDVGYILGGVAGTTYRGFQFSFDAGLAHLSLGNWMQLQAMTRLAEAGITRYDLGTDMAYKLQWADLAFETVSVILRRE